MTTGILFGFLAYFAYALSDAAVKALGAHLPVFEIGFFVSAVALVLALFSKRRGDRWATILRPRRPFLLLARLATGTLGGICAVTAFTTLPLAEAYALIFLIPFFVAVLSVVLLKESVGLMRWIALGGGLAGVFLVVRPGFEALQFGHLAALGCAVFGAFTVILLRTLGPTENRLTLVGGILLAATLVNGVLMVPHFVVPDGAAVPLLIFAGACAGIGHLSMVVAARLAPASRLAPTQYSQIVWAALIGGLVFGEIPDPIAIAGMALVGFCGMTTLSSGRRPIVAQREAPLPTEIRLVEPARKA